MSRGGLLISFLLNLVLAMGAYPLLAHAAPQDSSLSQSEKARPRATRSLRPSEASLDAGSVSAGVYHNSGLGFSCRIPPGWVLRTDEMNVRDDDPSGESKTAGSNTRAGRVLLAAFSRPPLARAEDVNASILITVESAASYPGLTDAVQYFGPITEVAKSQGFEADEDPYGLVIGTKSLVRGDFQKNVGTRVMRQSTLAMLARGYAVSFTFIGGTEDEVEELIGGLRFVSGSPGK